MSKKSHFPKYNLYFEKIQESFWILFLFFELGLKSVPSSSLYSYFSRTVHDYSKNRKKIKLCYKNHIFRNFHFSVEVTILWETNKKLNSDVNVFNEDIPCTNLKSLDKNESFELAQKVAFRANCAYNFHPKSGSRT